MITYDNEHLNVLVQEVSKDRPNTDLIKSKTEALGIPYSPDMIILMSDILVYLSKNQKAKKSPLKEKLA